jgi:para-nitrobenzyl esterase
VIFGDFSIDADTYNEQDGKLSKVMSGAWVAFAKTGSPNAPGLARWPAFAGKESYLEFGDQIVAKEALRKKQIDFMSEFTEGLRSHAVTTAAGGSR